MIILLVFCWLVIAFFSLCWILGIRGYIKCKPIFCKMEYYYTLIVMPMQLFMANIMISMMIINLILL